MSKNKKKGKKAVQTLPADVGVDIPAGRENSFLPVFFSFKAKAIIIVLTGLAFYINTLGNKYALDDGIVIEKNKYVQQGFSGIGKILSTDAYASYYEYMNSKDQLSGGRYRPLSIVSFAVEQEFFGDNATVRHLGNVLFFVVSLFLLFYFLHKFMFCEWPDIAFITTLLFAIHPLHTEVVANIKSRDEIFSLMFIITTFIFTFQYHQSRKFIYLPLALFSYFLALLSKEYAVTLIVFIPLLFYLLLRCSIVKSLVGALPFFAVALVYVLIRYSIVVFKTGNVQPDVLNDPFMFAKGSEALATKIYILNKYLKLLFWPHPLAADYSWKTIPYESFSSLKVLWSLILHAGIVILGIVLLVKRHILSFAVWFYLAHLLMVSNLLMDLGATMGERLAYHSSLGFCMVIAWLLVKTLEKISNPKLATTSLFIVVIPVLLLSGFKTIERNKDWESDTTLFIKDVNTVPNSVMVNGNAGARFIDLSDKPENKVHQKEYLHKAIQHLSKAIQYHPTYVAGYLNRGIAWYKLEDYAKAETDWNEAKRRYPSHPLLKEVLPILATAYLNKALKLGQKQEFSEAIKWMEHAKSIHPENAEIWYNLGGAYFTVKEFTKAKENWEKCLELKPDHPDAKKGLAALASIPEK